MVDSEIIRTTMYKWEGPHTFGPLDNLFTMLSGPKDAESGPLENLQGSVFIHEIIWLYIGIYCFEVSGIRTPNLDRSNFYVSQF